MRGFGIDNLQDWFTLCLILFIQTFYGAATLDDYSQDLRLQHQDLLWPSKSETI